MVDIAALYKNDPELRAVSLGVEVQNYVQHEKIGQYLVERAHESRAAALEALAVIDPMDFKAVAQLQWQARIPDLFVAWLDEAVVNGSAAEENIRMAELP
jgi:hypothetical protein